MLSSAAENFVSKLAPEYGGPFTITKLLSPVVYELRIPHRRKSVKVHVKDLKPYHGPEKVLSPSTES